LNPATLFEGPHNSIKNKNKVRKILGKRKLKENIKEQKTKG